MGVLDTLRSLRSVNNPLPAPQVAAAYENTFVPTWWSSGIPRVSRDRALTVPAVSRARNLIAGVGGSLPLRRYSRFDRRQLPDLPFQFQPDPAYPGSVTWSYIIDSMLFYGQSYCQVISLYADGRVQHFRWLDPSLIQENVGRNNEIIGYNYDGADLPRSGVGSVIVFYSFNDGVLTTSGRTIETAIELEEATNRAAKEPAPQVVLKNEGVSLPAAKIQDLLAGWKAARRERATAYLDASMKIETVGFDPRSQQLVEAREYHANELSRAMNLPPFFLGAEANSMTYQNTESIRRDLIDFSLQPYLTAIEARLNMPDFSSRDQLFRFDLDIFLRGSARERVEIIKTLLEIGVISVEEARAFEDLAPRGNDETRI